MCTLIALLALVIPAGFMLAVVIVLIIGIFRYVPGRSRYAVVAGFLFMMVAPFLGKALALSVVMVLCLSVPVAILWEG